MYVGQYKEGNIFNHSETRSRKLLLHKKEIKKLDEGIKLKGITLVPVKLYFKENKLKVSLAVCRGKKDYDKRESIKQRDIKREVAKSLKNY
jgi:SsrA-binding protein